MKTPYLLSLVSVASLASCTVAVAPDGSKSATVDGPQATAFAEALIKAFAPVPAPAAAPAAK